MTWDPAQNQQLDKSEGLRHAGDRYAGRGVELIQEAALAAIEKLNTLPAGQAEHFASSFKKRTERLTVAQDKLSANLALLPATLPEALVEPKPRQFPTSRKRAMTGREAAEEQEADERRQRRIAAVTDQGGEARAKHEENESQRTAALADSWLQSQSQELDFSSLEEISGSSSDSSSTRSSNSSSNSNDEPRRSSRVRRPTRDVVSQLEQDAVAAVKEKKKGKGKKV